MDVEETIKEHDDGSGSDEPNIINVTSLVPSIQQLTCFLCLRGKEAFTKSFNLTESESIDVGVSEISVPLKLSISERFLYFCQHYLKTEMKCLYTEECQSKGKEGKRKLAMDKFKFCEKCENMLNPLLNTYEEITMLRARLMWGVGQLGEVLRKSSQVPKSNSCMIKGVKSLDLLRKEVQEKCHSKAQLIQPEVSVSVSPEPLTAARTTTRKKRNRFPEKESQNDPEFDFVVPDIGVETEVGPKVDYFTEDFVVEQVEVKTKTEIPDGPSPPSCTSNNIRRRPRRTATSQKRIKRQLVKNKKEIPILKRTRTKSCCSHCEASFRHRLQLLQHVAMVHEGLAEDFLKCSVCQEAKESFFELKKHLEETHENSECKTIYCVFCPQNFTTQQLCNLHRREQHSKAYLAGCPLLFCDKDDCPESFMSVLDLNEHLKSHVPPIYNTQSEGVEGQEVGGIFWKCAQCGRGFLNPIRCELHQILHVPKDPDGFFHCPKFDECQTKFRWQRKLLNHYNKKHIEMGEQVALHVCDLCKKRPYFISRRDLETHLKRHALEVHCRICGEVCLGSNALLVHKYNKHPDDFKLFQMPKPKPSSGPKVNEDTNASSSTLSKKITTRTSTSTASSLPTGEERTELVGLSRKCPYCRKKFLTFPELEKHKVSEHGISVNRQPANLVCHICGLVVTYKGSLVRHMLTHSEPTIECPYKCGRKFRRVHNMEMHVLKAHKKGEVKPQFVCDICGRSYLSRGLLNRHKKEHDRTIQCTICHKMVRTTSRLKEHMRASHSDEKFNCKWCESEYTWETKLIAHVKKKHPENFDDYYAERVNWRSLTKLPEVEELGGTNEKTQLEANKETEADGEPANTE